MDFAKIIMTVPCSGMEQSAAKIAWEWSISIISMHNMRYKYMLCDGDSKALNDLNNSHKPYGDIKIEKLDCVNHVHKLGMHRSHRQVLIRRRLMPNRFRIGGCRKTPLCRLLAPIIYSSKDTFV